MMTRVIALLIASLPAASLAQVQLSFDEGAPKDTFTITNRGACDIGAVSIQLDMSDSAGGLYFDTTDQGAGVEVFQPFKATQGAELVISAPPITDGDTALSLDLSGLGPEQSVAFTIDVDDTARDGTLGQTRVAGSEIAGTTAILIQGEARHVGVFDDTSQALIRVTACTS